MDVLEYLVRLHGAAQAAAQMRGFAAAVNQTAGAQARMAVTGREAEASSGKLAAAGGLMAKGVAGGTLALVGIGLEAVKMSTTFNHEMLRIRTDAGASTAELNRMKAGVLDLAASGQSMGQGPMSLAQGLYHLESLGIRGSRALQALKLASQESAISGANLEQTTSAMGAAMFLSMKDVSSLKDLMGVLNATVGAGNMRFQDLVEALGTGILPSAKVAGLSLRDVGAALAVATDSGYQASSAAAQLGTALHFLYAPSDKAKSALSSIGLSSTQLAQDMHKPEGLLVALMDLKDHLKGLSEVQQAQVLNSILPGGRGRILLTELSLVDRLRGKYAQINQTAAGFGGSVAAQAHDPQTQLKTQEARIQADMVRLGNALGPYVIPALTGLLKVGASFLEWLAKVPNAIAGVIKAFRGLGSTGAGLGHSISSAFSSIGKTATSLWRTVSRTFSDIVKAAKHAFGGEFGHDLAIIGTRFIQFGAIVFKVIGTITRLVLPGLVNMVKGAFAIIRGAVQILAGILTLDFGKAWDGVKSIFSGAIKEALGFLQAATAPFRAAASAIADAIASGLSAVGNLILGVIKAGINDGIIAPLNFLIDMIDSISVKIPSWVPGVGGNSIGFHIGHIPALAQGGTIGRAGAVMVGERGPEILGLPSGATVTPLNQAGWAGGDLVINVDGRQFARIQRRQIVKAMAANA